MPKLEEIDPFCRHLPEVLSARLAIYHGLKKWDLLAVVAKRLAEWNPKEPGFFIEFAYATRRAESIHAAHAILTRAAGLHPTNPTIQFNLACYEAQMGSLDRAKAHLKRATEIQSRRKARSSGCPAKDLQSFFETSFRPSRRRMEKVITSSCQPGKDPVHPN